MKHTIDKHDTIISMLNELDEDSAKCRNYVVTSDGKKIAKFVIVLKWID